jgi:hypothetical protein
MLFQYHRRVPVSVFMVKITRADEECYWREFYNIFFPIEFSCLELVSNFIETSKKNKN